MLFCVPFDMSKPENTLLSAGTIKTAYRIDKVHICPFKGVAWFEVTIAETEA